MPSEEFMQTLSGDAGKKRMSDRQLFERVVAVRAALSKMLAAVEPRMMQEIVNLDMAFCESEEAFREREDKNTMIVCIDGREIITCTADTTALASRNNAVWTEMGEKHVKTFRDQFEKILGAALPNAGNVSEPSEILSTLDDLRFEP